MKYIIWLLVVVDSLTEATLPACKNCPINGQWGTWTDHTTCSGTCGLYGQKVQKRLCSSWTMGCPCKGAVSRIIPCATAICPTGAVCASGFKKYMPEGGTKYVCGNITRADDYKAPGCKITTKMHACPCPTGGAWTAWQNASPCQKFDYNFTTITCGMCGRIAQTRHCKSQDYGCPCTGVDRRQIVCPKNPCKSGGKCCNNLPVVTNLETKGQECGLNVWVAPIMNPIPACYTTTTTTTTVTTTAPCASGCSEADLLAKWSSSNQSLTLTYTTDENGCQTAGYICSSTTNNSIYFSVRPEAPEYPDWYPDTGYYRVELVEIGTNIVSKQPNPFRCALTSPTPQWQLGAENIVAIYCQTEGPMGAW